jgi:hypothetical protein
MAWENFQFIVINELAIQAVDAFCDMLQLSLPHTKVANLNEKSCFNFFATTYI